LELIFDSLHGNVVFPVGHAAGQEHVISTEFPFKGGVDDFG